MRLLKSCLFCSRLSGDRSGLLSMRLLKSCLFCPKVTGDMCGLLSILHAIIEELFVLFQIDWFVKYTIFYY